MSPEPDSVALSEDSWRVLAAVEVLVPDGIESPCGQGSMRRDDPLGSFEWHSACIPSRCRSCTSRVVYGAT